MIRLLFLMLFFFITAEISAPLRSANLRQWESAQSGKVQSPFYDRHGDEHTVRLFFSFGNHASGIPVSKVLSTDHLPLCPAQYDDGSGFLPRLLGALSGKTAARKKSVLSDDVILFVLTLVFTVAIASITPFLNTAALAFQRERTLIVYLYHQRDHAH